MNAILRAKADVAEQGSRTLRAKASLLSTRQAVEEQLGWREKAYKPKTYATNIGIKSLRRLRLFMVPSFATIICLLP